MRRITDFILKVFFFVIFFTIITPVGVLLRLGGIDYLQRRLEKERKSYWIEKGEG